MATVTVNGNGNLTVQLSEVEQDTLSGLPDGQLESYITLWLQERSRSVFENRFSRLSQADQAQIMQKIRSAQ
jgi:hypothetical protein